jgi:hypothetical protein
MVAYLLSGESIRGKEQNGLGALGIVREIHLEITQAVLDSAIEDIRVQAKCTWLPCSDWPSPYLSSSMTSRDTFR